MTFDNLVEQISSGTTVAQKELLPFLCLESKAERGVVNFRLAEAFARAEKWSQAKVFIDRAWILSDFSDSMLELLKKICYNLEDIHTLREAYKRRGICLARKGRIDEALEAFNQWQYAYAAYYKLDRYAYDFDIMDTVEDMVKPHSFIASSSRPAAGEKIRLAYLVYGMGQDNSVLVKINLMFAKYHNKSLFAITFFVPESARQLRQCRKNIKDISLQFKEHDCEVVFAPHKTRSINRLLSCARQIHEFRPHVLVTGAALADFKHLFITSLRPAPIVVGLLQGPPPQFVAPNLDWAISWSRHPLIDSPINTSYISIGVPLPAPPDTILDRASFSIPSNAVVLMSAGRYVKYQDRKFWFAVIELLKAHPETCYVAVGVERNQLALLDMIEASTVADRIRLLGWRTDCVELLSLADIVIDTYPSGGGHVLIDAMALGVPFVSFENNYLRSFDQTDWSVADEFVDIPELIVPRGDFERFHEAVSALIRDAAYRRKMGELCKLKIYACMENPQKGVQEFEARLLQFVNKCSAFRSNKEGTVNKKDFFTNLFLRIRKRIAL